MDETQAHDTRVQLTLDLLSDIILKHLVKQASPALREATLAVMEMEIEEQLDFEMTSELLGCTDFRVRPVA